MGLSSIKASSTTGHGLTTHRHQLYHQGIEVLGAMIMTHERASSDAAGLQSDVAPEMDTDDAQALTLLQLDTMPRISSEEAAQIALGILGRRDLEAKPSLKILRSTSEEPGATLLYAVSIAPTEAESGRDLWIDAKNGRLLADLSHDWEIAPTEVLQATDQCQTIDEKSGAPLTLNLAACPVAQRSGADLEASDASSRRAEKNAQIVLKYFWTRHGRDSFDDRGSTVTSVVHVGDQFANAFWSSDRNFMAYGDGDGKVMTDLTKSLDVAGHEMTHGVTSQTSKLIYQSESGALNEAFSDFFGIAVAARGLNAPAEWAIGKDIFLNERKQIGLRNLKAPASIMARTRDDQGNIVTKPYPSHVKDQFTTLNACSSQNDRCFVHINSMIPGHAMYQMAERLGLEKAEKLLYVTLSQYLTPTSDFKAFRTQTVKACRQLFSGTDCTKVTAAFRTVGL
jgi:Zn-dependent metalloprotease